MSKFMCISNKLQQVSFKVIIDDIILFVYGSKLWMAEERGAPSREGKEKRAEKNLQELKGKVSP